MHEKIYELITSWEEEWQMLHSVAQSYRDDKMFGMARDMEAHARQLRIRIDQLTDLCK